MRETMVHPPRTIMEVFKMLPEGTLAEVIENTLYMSPAPTGNHQRVLINLSTALNSFVIQHKRGMVLTAPLEVFLDQESNAVQPDILFISAERLEIFDPNGGVHGAPDLIIEILSAGNRKHDLIVKKALYERFAVKEYWVVDPDTKVAVGYFLNNGKYELIAEVSDIIQSKLLNESFRF